MSLDHPISRRRFFGAAGALAGAAALGSWGAPRAFSGTGEALGERLVPPGKLGVQQWAIRDSITRLRGSVQGLLGGPGYPEDGTDLGSAVTLPGGFAETFEFLAGLGYRGFEFFQFSQGANGAITIPEIRTALDNAGLIATGTHTGSLATMINETNRATQIANAQILGYSMIGTASDPVSSNTRTLALWQQAAQRANTVGQALADVGMKYYFHPEQNWWQFFNDPAHPELSRTHLIDWFTANTDPSLVHFEPDLFHMYSGRARFPDPVDGSLWDAWGWIQTNWKRILAWHVKDGSRIANAPAPPAQQYTQTIQRTASFTDALIVGEGALLQGHPVDPDPAIVGYKRIFDDTQARGFRFFLAESDGSIGNAVTDPGRSLRWAKYSAQFLLGFRAGTGAHAESEVSEETQFLSEALAG